MKPPKSSSILRKSSNIRVKITKAIARHTKIRDQNPSRRRVRRSRDQRVKSISDVTSSRVCVHSKTTLRDVFQWFFRGFLRQRDMHVKRAERCQNVQLGGYYVKSFDERDDEAKAPTRQITGHKDLLASRDAHIQVMRKSIPELDGSVTNATEILQMQQAEFVAAVCRRCSRHQGVPPGENRPRRAGRRWKSGRHVRAKPRARRLMVLARRPFSFLVGARRVPAVR